MRNRVPNEEPRVYVLDGLRLVAALSVVAFHLVAGAADRAWGAPTTGLFGPLVHPARYGWLGVELFFLISGFVICLSSWGRTAGQFAVSRFVRLFPAYWFAVLATTAVVTAVPLYEHHLHPDQVLVNLTMLQVLLPVPLVDPSYWTLTVELAFYAVFGLIAVTRGVTYRRVVIFCAVWSVASLFLGHLGNRDAGQYLGPRFAPYFVAGVAFYLIYRFGPTLLSWGIVAVSWATAMFRLQVEVQVFRSGFWPAAFVVSAFFVLMAAIALRAFDRVQWRWLTTAGALTYPLYLLHQIIGLTVISALHRYLQPWALLTVVVGGLLLASWLVYRVVERPLAGPLKRALNRSLEHMRAEGRPPAAPSGELVQPRTEVELERQPVMSAD